jgi:predicted patatin/cPLA2 family phospholipase
MILVNKIYETEDYLLHNSTKMRKKYNKIKTKKEAGEKTIKIFTYTPSKTRKIKTSELQQDNLSPVLS